MSTLAYLAALVAALTVVAAVIGVAICSHFDSGYFDGDDTDCHP